MVRSLKAAAVSSLLLVSSCASLVSGAVLARSPNCDGFDDAAECVAKEHAEALNPISQDAFDSFVKRDASPEQPDMDYLVPISPGSTSDIFKRGDGNEPRAFTPVTGVRGAGVVNRVPIGHMRGQQPDTFNMFVLALNRLMNFPQDRELSWFKLAGIHGLPFEPWQYPDSATVNPGIGYCTHSSSIFLTWHRPYLLLIEQMLHGEAVAIANQFRDRNQKAKYLAAAQKVRVPYWDWSASGTRSRIPDVLKQQRISVVTPNGRQTINNPLFGYRFANGQPPQGSGFGPITTRGPDDQRLQDTYPGRRQGTLDYFTRSTFNPASELLEGIHGGVHVFIGGDMPIIPRSSFDPIFWLHHCNVDRLTAMYQATHPGTYLTPRRRSPTFALGGNAQDDINTRLYPFRHGDGREWTSNDIRDARSIHQYGYAYPEVPVGMAQPQLREFTTRRINELYGPNTQAREFSAQAEESPDTQAVEPSNTQEDEPPSPQDTVFSTVAPESPDTQANESPDTQAKESPDAQAKESPDAHPEVHSNKSRGLVSSLVSRIEWNALVEYDLADCTSSYEILLYLDPIDLKSSEDTHVPENLAGAAAIFGGMSGSVAMPTGKVTQTVPLTPKLLERTNDLGVGLVSSLLGKHLSWSVNRVCEKTGHLIPVPVDEIKSLKVSVVSSTVEYSTDMSELPKKLDEMLHLKPTDGKIGGLSAGDALPQLLENVDGILDLVGNVFKCVGKVVEDVGDKVVEDLGDNPIRDLGDKVIEDLGDKLSPK